MVARFILSLDCEGKWGVADHLTRREHEWLSETRLRRAYCAILELLDAYDLPATFAFVGLFAEPEDSFRHFVPELRELAEEAPEYLGPVLVDSSEGSRQGWHGGWAVDSVASADLQHEIALHGVTHVPWTSQGADFFKRELALFGQLTSPVAQARTFVFPRNAVAHLNLLPSAELKGYRMAPPPKSRARSLLSEFDVWSAPERESPALKSGLVPIPGGYFVNWRRGARRAVPRSVTRQRFQQLLDWAENGGIVHAWMHPENVASAPETLEVLQDIVSLVARARDSGRCVPMTQIEYVASLSSKAQ